MKRLYAVFFTVFLAFFASGCGTIYESAVDQRSVEQQAKDTQISAAVRKAFYDDEQIKGLGFTSYCFLGDVYLVGEDTDPSQKSRAIQIARGVEGVKSVTAYILPHKDDPACGTATNIELIATITGKLIGDSEIYSTNIEVDAVDCHVVLVGLVHAQDQIDKAVAHARSASGVRSVKSYLRVYAPGK